MLRFHFLQATPCWKNLVVWLTPFVKDFVLSSLGMMFHSNVCMFTMWSTSPVFRRLHASLMYGRTFIPMMFGISLILKSPSLQLLHKTLIDTANRMFSTNVLVEWLQRWRNLVRRAMTLFLEWLHGYGSRCWSSTSSAWKIMQQGHQGHDHTQRCAHTPSEGMGTEPEGSANASNASRGSAMNFTHG